MLTCDVWLDVYEFICCNVKCIVPAKRFTECLIEVPAPVQETVKLMERNIECDTPFYIINLMRLPASYPLQRRTSCLCDSEDCDSLL